MSADDTIEKVVQILKVRSAVDEYLMIKNAENKPMSENDVWRIVNIIFEDLRHDGLLSELGKIKKAIDGIEVIIRDQYMSNTE